MLISHLSTGLWKQPHLDPNSGAMRFTWREKSVLEETRGEAGRWERPVPRPRSKGEEEGQGERPNSSGYWEGGAGRDGDQPEIYVTSQDTDRQRGPAAHRHLL